MSNDLPPKPVPERFAYSIREAATLLSISRAGLYRLVKDGHVKLVKIGCRSVIPRSEIVRLSGTEEAA